MSSLTKKQRKSLDSLEKRLAKKSDEWLTEYCREGGEQGNAVLLPGTKLYELRQELVDLRAKRNDMLEALRGEGRKI